MPLLKHSLVVHQNHLLPILNVICIVCLFHAITQPLLEEMARQKMETKETEYAEQVLNQDGSTLQDLLNFKPEDGEIDTEDDESATQLEFADTDEVTSTDKVTSTEEH